MVKSLRPLFLGIIFKGEINFPEKLVPAFEENEEAITDSEVQRVIFQPSPEIVLFQISFRAITKDCD